MRSPSMSSSFTFAPKRTLAPASAACSVSILSNLARSTWNARGNRPSPCLVKSARKTPSKNFFSVGSMNSPPNLGT